MKQYNFIYSIGSDCACATYMKQAQLRTYASPFDWLTGTNFKVRTELILNNFEDFLNLENLTIIPHVKVGLADRANHNVKNIKTNFSFYHDFAREKTLEESFPAVKEKYNRRIQRFYKTINDSEKVLLIWFAHNWQTHDDEILTLCNKVCEKFNKQIDFLLIEHDEGMKIGEVRKVELAPNITRYYLYTRAWDEKGNPTTQGRVEDCLPIFKQYSLIVPLNIKLKKTLAKILIELVPVKKWRKQLRKDYL